MTKPRPAARQAGYLFKVIWFDFLQHFVPDKIQNAHKHDEQTPRLNPLYLLFFTKQILGTFFSENLLTPFIISVIP